MAQSLPRFIVVLTVFSTLLAGIPASATPGTDRAGAVSPSQADDDDTGTPRGEHESEQEIEESELENEFEIKLLAVRAEVCGSQADTFVAVDISLGRRSREFIRAATAIRGPPAA